MARVVKSMKDLSDIMDTICKELCSQLQERVYQTLNFFLLQYYSEWEGKYERTQAFLYSAFKTKVVKIKNGYQGFVYIDLESMNNYVAATGFQVADWANRGLHGGQDVRTDTHLGDDTIENTVANGDLVKLAKSFLIEKGLTIL